MKILTKIIEMNRQQTSKIQNGATVTVAPQNLHRCKQRKDFAKKVGFIFEKTLDFRSLLWYVVVLTEKEAQPMKNMIAYLARSLF